MSDSNRRKNARLFRVCDRIAEPLLEQDGRYNLTQIKVRLKERLIKAADEKDPLVDFDMMASEAVVKWDNGRRDAAERDAQKGDGTFSYAPKMECAFGDGTRVPLENLSRVEFYAWDKLQDEALDVIVKKHAIRKVYTDSRKRAWLPHHQTLNDVETQIFGFVPEPPKQPSPETEPA